LAFCAFLLVAVSCPWIVIRLDA